jgi:hypothetical protein
MWKSLKMCLRAYSALCGALHRLSPGAKIENVLIRLTTASGNSVRPVRVLHNSFLEIPIYVLSTQPLG